MRRRKFIALISASVTWPFAALAQEAGRTYGLGVLLPAARDVPVNAAFLDEFRRHGFFEGKNLSVEWRAYGPHPDLISQYAAELVEARVDVIAAGGVVGVRAAQRATATIPIVALVEDMLGDGLHDRFHETTQLHLWLSIHGMRPFRASHMIRTLKTLD